jgi:uncharacterized protein (UPF0332 family)
MTGHDFLPLATKLAAGAAEPDWRTAVSRAYYAAFHVARQLLSDLRFRVPHADRAHSYLSFRLSNCGDLQVQQAATELNDLRRRRNEADYDLHRPLLQRIAVAQLAPARRIIHVLDNLSAATRTQITDAMKIYERDVLGDVTWRP